MKAYYTLFPDSAQGGCALLQTRRNFARRIWYNMRDMAKDYADDSIKTLDPVTHIRMRPGMYVGEPGSGAMYHDCIYILMKEVIDNAVDEFGQGYGRRIDVTVNYDTGEVSVRDYGRGIPLGKVVDCVSQMNTGGKYDNENYQFSAGMNGVGTGGQRALGVLRGALVPRGRVLGGVLRGRAPEVEEPRQGQGGRTFGDFHPIQARRQGAQALQGARGARRPPHEDVLLRQRGADHRPQRTGNLLRPRTRRPDRGRGAVREALPADP